MDQDLKEKKEMQDGADEQPYPIRLPELYAYLSSFRPAACDFCGGRHWTVMLNDLDQISVISGIQNQLLNLNPKEGKGERWTWCTIESCGEKFFQLRCDNCGQVKLFSYEAVVSKIEEKRKGEWNVGNE